MMTSPSSLSMSSGLVNSILNMQTQLARSQKEMTSGTVADLGQALGANVGLDFSYGASNAMLTTIQATNGLVGSRLDVAQTALTSIQTDAQSLQSALLQASQPGGSSTGLATQAQDALSNLVSSLNTSIGGAYVFGGATTDAPPIAANPTTAGSAFQTAMASAITATFGSSAAAASATAATFQSNFTGVLSQVSAQGTTGQISLSSTTNPTSVTNVPTSVTANFVDPANPSTPVMQKLAEAYSLLSGASVQSLGQAGYDAALNVASTLVAQGVAGVSPDAGGGRANTEQRQQRQFDHGDSADLLPDADRKSRGCRSDANGHPNQQSDDANRNSLSTDGETPKHESCSVSLVCQGGSSGGMYQQLYAQSAGESAKPARERERKLLEIGIRKLAIARMKGPRSPESFEATRHLRDVWGAFVQDLSDRGKRAAAQSAGLADLDRPVGWPRRPISSTPAPPKTTMD